MAKSADQELNLPIVNAVNELRESNKDQRERLQKSMRTGLLNVRKSVDALSFGFERSLIDQSESQRRMHDATMEFQEASLEQGRHSGHLFAAKVTAFGAGLVAWFQKDMLTEFENITKAIKTGQVIHVKGDAGKSGKSDNELLMLINEGIHGKQKTNVKNTLLRIEELLQKHPGIAEVMEKERRRREEMLESLTSDQRDLFDAIKQKNEGFIISAGDAESKIESQREKESEQIEESSQKNDTKDVKSGLSWWQKIFRGVAGLGAGVLIFENWDKIKAGLIGIKNFLHGTYKFVTNNWDTIKVILETTAIIFAGWWTVSKLLIGWKKLVIATTATITSVKATSVAIATAYTAVKGKLLVALAAITPWILPIVGIAWAGNAILDAFNEAEEELGRTGSKWEAVKAGSSKFHESLITGPIDLITSMAGWVAGIFGFKEIEKKLNQIDSKSIYEDMKQWTTDLIKDMFDWVKDSYNAVRDWLFPDPAEIKQSVMSDPNINWPIFKDLTPGMLKSIEDQGAKQGFLFKKDKDAYDDVMKRIKKKETTSTPSGNGAGDQIIKGTVNGVPISSPIINNVTPVNTNNVQNNTTNSTTVMQPINTQPRGPGSIFQGQLINGLLVPY